MPIFTRTYVFQCFFTKIDPKMRPRSAQDRPKTAPRRSQRPPFSMSKFVFDFGRFGAPFWSLLGRLLGAKLAPKSDQKSTKNRPAPPDGPKIAQERSWGGLGRSWGDLGAVLGDYGAVLGGLGPKNVKEHDYLKNVSAREHDLRARGAVLGRSWSPC